MQAQWQKDRGLAQRIQIRGTLVLETPTHLGNGDVDGNRQQDEQGKIVHHLAKHGSAAVGVPDTVHCLFHGAEDEDNGDQESGNTKGTEGGKVGIIHIFEDGPDSLVQVAVE